MSDEFVENLKKPSAWLRVLYMAGYVVALYVCGVILLVLMLAQILISLLTGSDNDNLRKLGASLTLYVSQILQFLTYNSEFRPFPFAPFPLTGDGPDGEIDDVTRADTRPERTHSGAGPTSGTDREITPSTTATAAATSASVSTSTGPGASNGSAAKKPRKAAAGKGTDNSKTAKANAGKAAEQPARRSRKKATKPAAGKSTAADTTAASPAPGTAQPPDFSTNASTDASTHDGSADTPAMGVTDTVEKREKDD